MRKPSKRFAILAILIFGVGFACGALDSIWLTGTGERLVIPPNLRIAPLFGNARTAFIVGCDDAYATDIRLYKMLLQHQMRGTFFVVTSWLNKPGYLSSDDLTLLVKTGMEIGSHSHSHPYLIKITRDQNINELSYSKSQLERILRRHVTSYAYPYGDPGFSATQLWAYGYLSGRGTEVRVFRQDELSSSPLSQNISFWQMPVTAKLTTSIDDKLKVWDETRRLEGGVFYLTGHTESDLRDDESWNGLDLFFRQVEGSARASILGRESVWYTTQGDFTKYTNEMRETRIEMLDVSIDATKGLTYRYKLTFNNPSPEVYDVDMTLIVEWTGMKKLDVYLDGAPARTSEDLSGKFSYVSVSPRSHEIELRTGRSLEQRALGPLGSIRGASACVWTGTIQLMILRGLPVTHGTEDPLEE